MDQQGDLGVIEQQKEAKSTINMAKTRKQKTDANKRYQELNKEVKRRCRRGRRVYVESEAERAEETGKRGDARTLYEITRKLSGRLQNTCKPVRHEAGVLLRSAEDEMYQWREQFQTVLNHEEQLNLPEVEPYEELHIKTGRIKRIEIKNAIKKLNAVRCRCRRFRDLPLLFVCLFLRRFGPHASQHSEQHLGFARPVRSHVVFE